MPGLPLSGQYRSATAASQPCKIEHPVNSNQCLIIGKQLAQRADDEQLALIAFFAPVNAECIVLRSAEAKVPTPVGQAALGSGS